MGKKYSMMYFYMVKRILGISYTIIFLFGLRKSITNDVTFTMQIISLLSRGKIYSSSHCVDDALLGVGRMINFSVVFSFWSPPASLALSSKSATLVSCFQEVSSLWLLLFNVWCTSKDNCDYFGPSWVIQDSILLLRSTEEGLYLFICLFVYSASFTSLFHVT